MDHLHPALIPALIDLVGPGVCADLLDGRARADSYAPAVSMRAIASQVHASLASRSEFHLLLFLVCRRFLSRRDASSMRLRELF